MRKISLFLIFALITIRSISPQPAPTVYLEKLEGINPYRILIQAIGKVESGFDTMRYNPKEEAAGYFQIRPIRVLDYNRRTGSSYRHSDMFKYQIAEKIFLFYADLSGPYDLEGIARRWNGGEAEVLKESTLEYWKAVKAILQ